MICRCELCLFTPALTQTIAKGSTFLIQRFTFLLSITAWFAETMPMRQHAIHLTGGKVITTSISGIIHVIVKRIRSVVMRRHTARIIVPGRVGAVAVATAVATIRSTLEAGRCRTNTTITKFGTSFRRRRLWIGILDKIVGFCATALYRRGR